MTPRAPARLVIALWVLAAVVAGVGGVVRWTSPHMDVMFETDEADYVRALSYGAMANYLGTRERNGIGFVREVVEEYRRTGWARPFKRDWDAGDAAGLRHYHPPPALYPIGVLAASGVRGERALRTVPLVTGVLAVLASAWLAWVLLRGAPDVLRAAMAGVAGLVSALSPYHTLSSSTVGPHAAFSLLSTLALASLARAVQSADARWWVAACALTGIAALTVPYWVLLVPALLWAWWWGQMRSGRSWRLAGVGAAAALGAAVIVWPPFLLTAGFVKPVLLYVTLVASPPDVAGRAPGDWIVTFVRSQAMLGALLVIGVAGVVSVGRERRRALVPAALFAAAFILLNLRVSYMKPLYVSDIVPALGGLAAAISGWALAYRPAWVGALVVAVTAVLAVGSTRAAAGESPDEWRTALTALNERFVGQRVLVTPRAAGTMLTYYLDRVEIVLDSNHPDDVAAIDREISSGDVDAVMRWGHFVERDGAAARVIERGPRDGVTEVTGTLVSWWRTASGMPEPLTSAP